VIERLEGGPVGTSRPVALTAKQSSREAKRLLCENAEHRRRAPMAIPLGDGQAARGIQEFERALCRGRGRERAVVCRHVDIAGQFESWRTKLDHPYRRWRLQRDAIPRDANAIHPAARLDGSGIARAAPT
jgi:hypothetical protein